MYINQSIYQKLDTVCAEYGAQWIAVTKLRPVAALAELYTMGKRSFGENKAQELCDKYVILPKDIDWHFIGHLQSNKVKQIIDKVSTIHAVDTMKLLNEIQKPFTVLELNNKYDVTIVVSGGGMSGQAGAIRLAIAKALVVMNEDYKSALKRAELLGRDPREKERKKFGLKGARKQRQFTKR